MAQSVPLSPLGDSETGSARVQSAPEARHRERKAVQQRDFRSVTHESCLKTLSDGADATMKYDMQPDAPDWDDARPGRTAAVQWRPKRRASPSQTYEF